MASSVAANRNPTDRNADATVHIAQLDDKVTDSLLWELMVQASPVRHVYIPRDRITGAHFGYGFCEFHSPKDAHYATKILNMLPLFSKRIRISQSTVDRRTQDVGANLFIGNLVEEVDEKLLHDAFSAFGPLIDAPYIMRDPQTQESKRYAFVKFSSFEHSDSAIAAMDGQYICNTPITVQYAFKKDAESRERHGSQAERILAARSAEARRSSETDIRLRPHTLFSDLPASAVAAAAKKAAIQRTNTQPTPSLATAIPPPLPHQQHPAFPLPHHPHPSYPPQQAPFAYAPQPYPPAGGPMPQWQSNPRVAVYPPDQHSAYYQQPPIPLPYQSYTAQPALPTSQLGWSANRTYANGGENQAQRGHAQPYRGGQETYQSGPPHVDTGNPGGIPVRLPDDQAPPPP